LPKRSTDVRTPAWKVLYQPAPLKVTPAALVVSTTSSRDAMLHEDAPTGHTSGPRGASAATPESARRGSYRDAATLRRQHGLKCGAPRSVFALAHNRPHDPQCSNGRSTDTSACSNRQKTDNVLSSVISDCSTAWVLFSGPSRSLTELADVCCALEDLPACRPSSITVRVIFSLQVSQVRRNFVAG
jgi:hypothetical protein